MALLDSLEYRFGRFAIPGITRIIVIGQAILFVLLLANPRVDLGAMIELNGKAVLHGQVWRPISFLFYPPTLSPLFFLFAASVTWFIGDCLEHAWGSFKLNIFLLCSVVAQTVVAISFGSVIPNWIVLTTLFLAFAILAPDYEFLLFFILPVKAKWLGLINIGLLAFLFIGGGIVTKVTVLAGLLNCFLFFGPQAIRYFVFRQQVAARRSRFEEGVEEAQSEAMHTCKVCGRTDQSHPALDFRIARDGEEYCVEHLPSGQS